MCQSKREDMKLTERSLIKSRRKSNIWHNYWEKWEITSRFLYLGFFFSLLLRWTLSFSVFLFFVGGRETNCRGFILVAGATEILIVSRSNERREPLMTSHVAGVTKFSINLMASGPSGNPTWGPLMWVPVRRWSNMSGF